MVQWLIIVFISIFVAIVFISIFVAIFLFRIYQSEKDVYEEFVEMYKEYDKKKEDLFENEK